MKIRANSWHLRLVRWVRGMGETKRHYDYIERRWIEPYTPRDLCSYFWGGCLWTVFALLFALAFVGLLGFLLLLLVKAIIGDPLQALLGALIVVGLVGMCYGVVRYFQYRDAHPQPKAPNIVVEGIKAIKHRYCPIITVEEEEEG